MGEREIEELDKGEREEARKRESCVYVGGARGKTGGSNTRN